LDRHAAHDDLSASHKFNFPDVLEVHEVTAHLDTRYRFSNALGRPAQLVLMALRFGLRISPKSASKPPVRTTIGMRHQYDALCPMQSNGGPDLIQDELTIRLTRRRCKRLRATRDFDDIGVQHTTTLQILCEGQMKAVIEAPYDHCFCAIVLARRIEMKDSSHGGLCPKRKSLLARQLRIVRNVSAPVLIEPA
jgi:hypothetical protein